MSGATAASIATYASIAGTIVGVGSAIQSGMAQSAQAKFQAQQARNAAIIAGQNAAYEDQRSADAKKRGLEERDALRRKISVFEGSQRAGFAASGVTLDTGSPLDTINDTNFLGEIDVQNTLSNSRREAYGYDMNAYNYRASGAASNAQASAYRMQTGNFGTAINALSTGLAGASSVAEKWTPLKQKK